MLAQPSSIYNGYNEPVIEPVPLYYQQHSISRSDNLHVQPLEHPNHQYNANNQYRRHQPSQPAQLPQQPQVPLQQAQYRSDDNPAPAAQNFLSTFFREHHQYISPLTHTRNYFPVGEPFSTTPRSPRLSGHRNVESIPKASASFDTSILGSGDFGVLRGGTFYQDNDPTLFRSSESSNEFSYYNNKNGHGRPQTAAYVQRYTYPEDQFANFRDFADINTPNEPAFSHYVVVYTNRNGTATKVVQRETEDDQELEGDGGVEQRLLPQKYEPKNILDQLRLLDAEKVGSSGSSRSTVAKVSKNKKKLRRTKLTKTYNKQETLKEPADVYEDALEDALRIDATEPIDPLLALS